MRICQILFVMDKKLYDVVIYEKLTLKIYSIIGKNMRSWDGNGTGRNTAELRVQTGRERINEHYECMMVPSGKYKNGDIIKYE